MLRTDFKRFALKIERRALRTAPADLAGPAAQQQQKTTTARPANTERATVDFDPYSS
ncbi:hypothetical protein [Streptomyces sp. NBC_01727]|uniref:hypothetical protein n=1 Tax=Streptomyces sp. NBC_01727 TaxID=2975924 RepID=UPI002E147BD6|nr:hypothetical protein OIE76_40130 [Streptomyces sp. NBC_01727]